MDRDRDREREGGRGKRKEPKRGEKKGEIKEVEKRTRRGIFLARISRKMTRFI